MTSPALSEPDMSVIQRRYRARHWLWAHGRSWQRRCGRATTGGAVALLQYPDGSVRGEGLQHCMSVWSCPVCSARTLAARAESLAEMLSEWKRRGGHVGMMTLTLRHNKGQRLADLWDAALNCWSAAVATTSWTRPEERHGVPIAGRLGVVKRRIPLVRSVEVTYSDTNGWHPHMHVLVFLPPSTEAQADDLLTELFQGVVERWTMRAEKLGFKSLARVQEAHLLRGDDYATQAGAYLAKQVLGGVGDDLSAAQELTRADLKSARLGSRTPFQLLDDLAAGSQDRDTFLAWQEFCDTSRGRRQMTSTIGLARYLGVEDLDDDTAAWEASEAAQEAWEPKTEHYVNRAPCGPPALVGVAGSKAWRAITGTGWAQLRLLLTGSELWRPPETVRVYPDTGTASLGSRMAAVGLDEWGLAIRQFGESLA